MAAGSRRGKLAYKILFWFLLISVGPVLVVGYNLVNISQASLRKETLSMQESLAVGFSDTVNKYVMSLKNVIADTAALEDFSSMNAAKQQQYLNRILQVHLAVLELSVANAQGQETLRTGRFLEPNPKLRDVEEEEWFLGAMKRGQYVGHLERFQGLYPALTIAVAIVDPEAQPPRPIGVLEAKVSLNGLSTMLSMEFPPAGKSVAAVVAPDGFLVAHSNLKEVYRPDARLPDDILKIITTQSNEKGGGEISMPDGSRLLGAYSDVRDLNWVVYVQQPIDIANKTAAEMTRQTLTVLGWVVLCILLLSLAVANHITQPVRLLRELADRTGRGQFEGDLSDIPSPTNDEIGDLQQTFLTMRDSLKEKTGELIHAKQELERFTKFLEKRVDARTRELKAAQDELIKKERLAAIGQMASVVGHEIRNPLAVINNSIYFIKTKLGQASAPDPKVAKHIKIIESEILQANGIINEILTYSRQRDLKPERVLVNNWLEELLSVYPFPPHIAVEKRFDPANPAIEIDTAEMQQAVRNLIGNGIEVMPQKGTIHVRTARQADGNVLIEIGDTGPGIPPEVLDKIFAPFFTTKARGTGLGLAVVRKVMDRHRGRVDVESAAARGTIFRLYLPAAWERRR
ncbi:MAG: HAMP domain-containing protein [Elusimicrobia bacterium]|nr:HAMP domain-containing protein [Elusimicrobiota bacterium]MDE2426218.1 HAMP domain-containing protein [Elusimicrobiota bacterium]